MTGRAWLVAAVGAIGVAAVASAPTGARVEVAEGAGVALVTVASLVLIAGLAPPRERRRGRVASRPREVPKQLAENEALLRDVIAHAGSAERRLRPLVVEVVEERLARRGLSLQRDPAAARTLLGKAIWRLVGPDREPPRDPRAPGPSAAELTLLLEELDRL